MSEVYISRIILFSAKEKKGRIVNFKSGLNVILGGNDTGKSIIIKSIFSVLGADVELDSRWKNSGTTIVLEFYLGEASYSVIKWGKTFGVLEEDTLSVFESISKGLGPKLAEIFSFGMVWNNEKGEEIIPPPAYYLLPFYQDQDKSWTNNWSSFNRLYLKNIRRDLVDYHIGVKPNEYYTAKVKLNQVNIQIKEIEKDLSVLYSLLKDAEKTIEKRIDVSLSKEDFEEEIKSLILVTESLYHEQVKVRSQIQKYYSSKFLILEQIDIVSKSLKELRKDMEFATKDLKDEIECPTCGAAYQNSFQERFSIAQDEYECFELLQELNDELKGVNQKIEGKQLLIETVNSEIERVENRLNEAKKNVTLSDVIEAEGEKQMRTLFNEKINDLEKILKDLLLNNSKLKGKIAVFNDKERKNEIIEKYRVNMRSNLFELNLMADGEQFNSVYTKISGLGSARPRASLAYFFSVQALSKQYSSYSHFPIIIDEPEQQGQDKINMPAILKFLNKNKSLSHQTILGLQNTGNVDELMENVVVETLDKYSVMNQSDFLSAEKIVVPLIEKIVALKDKE